MGTPAPCHSNGINDMSCVLAGVNNPDGRFVAHSGGEVSICRGGVGGCHTESVIQR